jgi:transcriptional regulator with XRE-family HTH domain
MERPSSSPAAHAKRDALAERVAELRLEHSGRRGVQSFAAQLGLRARTWYNYETGKKIPGDVILKLIELTNVEPRWLQRGEGPKYRLPEGPRGQPIKVRVARLIREALELLERVDRAV